MIEVGAVSSNLHENYPNVRYLTQPRHLDGLSEARKRQSNP